MARRRAHVLLPDDLVTEIDRLVGFRGRSAFLTELARREVQRLRFLELLDRPGPGWNLAEHPELKDGAAAWVRRIRQDDQRIDENNSR